LKVRKEAAAVRDRKSKKSEALDQPAGRGCPVLGVKTEKPSSLLTLSFYESMAFGPCTCLATVSLLDFTVVLGL
jgi:hypothetical protein